MKQITQKYDNGNICLKWYENDVGQIHSLYISNYDNGKIMYKTNYVNGKRYGLYTWYKKNGKIANDIYYL